MNKKLQFCALLLMISLMAFGQAHSNLNPTNIKQAYLDRYPSHHFMWNKYTGMPHRAFGQPIPVSNYSVISEQNVEQASRDFLKTLPGWTEALELELKRVIQANDYWYVSFIQKVGAIEVWNTEVELRINSRAEVTAFGFDVYQNLNVPANDILSAESATSALINHAISENFQELTVLFTSEVQLFPFISEQDATCKLFYAMNWSSNNPPHHEQTWIDAQTGDILKRENKLCQATIEGNVNGEILPELATDIPTVQALPHLNIQIDNDVYTSDADGNFLADINDSTTLTAELKGPFINVTRLSGNDAIQELQVAPNETVNLQWDNSNSLLSERNVFYHSMRTYDFLKSFDPDFTTLDYPLQNIVEDNNATCNAYWTGTNIHYNVGAPNCINSAHSACTIAHEYGHAINDHVYNAAGVFQGMQSITLHEAMADVTACLLLDEHEFAQGFFGVGTFTRDLLNTRRYPDDVVGQQHTDGLILGGSFWDLRELTSIETAYHLAHFAKYGTPDDPDLGTAFGEYFLEVLLADDDDGDLSNGTPHYAEINEAFCNHGIGMGLFFSSTVSHDELENTVDSANPYPVSLEYQSVISDNLAGNIYLHYSTNYFQNETSILMSNIGNDEYTSEIPAQEAGTIVKYYFTYEEPNCTVQKFPAGDKESEHYSFLVGPYDIKWSDDFENNLGWTIGSSSDNATAGIWERADPVQTISDAGTLVQPGEDHSPTGSLCFVTGAQHGQFWYSFDVDNGKTTLTSPIFSGIDGLQTVVQYYKWYVQGAGTVAPTQDVWLVEISNDGGGSWTTVESTFQATNLKWTKVQFKIEDFIEPTDIMRMRFVAADYNPGSIVEALVDDFEVLSINDLTSVQSIDASGQVKITPNPTSDMFTLSFSDFNNWKNASIKIADSMGRLVHTSKLQSSELAVQVNDWPTGIYFVQINSKLHHSNILLSKVK